MPDKPVLTELRNQVAILMENHDVLVGRKRPDIMVHSFTLYRVLETLDRECHAANTLTKNLEKYIKERDALRDAMKEISEKQLNAPEDAEWEDIAFWMADIALLALEESP